jgi:hypothetical protein
LHVCKIPIRYSYGPPRSLFWTLSTLQKESDYDSTDVSSPPSVRYRSRKLATSVHMSAKAKLVVRMDFLHSPSQSIYTSREHRPDKRDALFCSKNCKAEYDAACEWCGVAFYLSRKCNSSGLVRTTLWLVSHGGQLLYQTFRENGMAGHRTGV